MAKSHPAPPGTNTRGGVRSTMTPAFGKGASTGSQQNMNAPFDAPRSGGDNGLPTRVYDRMGGPGSAPAASTRDVPGTILTNPKGRRR